MKIIIKEESIKTVSEMVKGPASKQFKDQWKLRPKNGKCKIDISQFDTEALQKLHEHLDGLANDGDRSAALSRNLVEQWQEIRSNPQGQKAPKLEAVPPIMGQYIATAAHRYVFEQTPDGNMVPWFVNGIVYHAPNPRNGVPAHVTVSLKGINTGMSRSRRDEEGKRLNIGVDEWRGRTMSEILNHKGFYLETTERMKSYDKEVERFLEHCNDDGWQMRVTGKCKQFKGWYDHNYRPVEKSGSPAKMVIDPTEDEWEETAVECTFWDGNMSGEELDGWGYEDDYDETVEAEAKEPKLWQLPIHPVYRMFDLDEHGHYRVHVNNTVDYEYDLKVGEKLVLPRDIKEFIEVLIEHSKNSFVDIVSGKEGGTVILLEGPPGTGKTLSAEVYSEIMQRPLYKVQSSQLGTSPNGLEEQLKEVLARAERWGAILLIDEADVYVYERGDDIIQNAIVGVFLRVLEYYRGVLFMTTNRGTMVDDAIVSRLTARFRYQKPSVEDQKKLWDILSKQNGVELDTDEVDRIIKVLPGLSGRDIKNLLKLAYVMSLKRGCAVDADLLKFVAQFKQMGEESKPVNTGPK